MIIGDSLSVSLSNVDQEKKKLLLLLTTEEFDLLKEQTEIRCPIANMILSSGCTIDVNWIQLRTSNNNNKEEDVL